MNAVQHIAWICTGPAPTGNELFTAQLTALGAVMIGLLVYGLLMYTAKKRIKQKGWRFGVYALLTAVFIAGLALVAFYYAISTC